MPAAHRYQSSICLAAFSESSCGHACVENVIDDGIDEEFSNQLKNVERHLNNLVLKNLQFHYIGEDIFVDETLTKTDFKAFHQGSSIAIAGQFDVDSTFPDFQYEISGQSTNGEFHEQPLPTPFVTNGCVGKATMCPKPNFGGDCISVDR